MRETVEGNCPMQRRGAGRGAGSGDLEGIIELRCTLFTQATLSNFLWDYLTNYVHCMKYVFVIKSIYVYYNYISIISAWHSAHSSGEKSDCDSLLSWLVTKRKVSKWCFCEMVAFHCILCSTLLIEINKYIDVDIAIDWRIEYICVYGMKYLIELCHDGCYFYIENIIQIQNNAKLFFTKLE